MTRRLALAALVLAATPAAAQDAPFVADPRIAWERSVGARGPDRIAALAALPDGSVAAAGTRFAGGTAEGDAWLVLFDAQGIGRWARTAGGTGEQGLVALAALDEGLAAVGEDRQALRPLAGVYGLQGEPVWQGAGSLGRDLSLLAAAAGEALVLAGAQRTARAAQGVAVALDPATGEERWRTPDPGDAGSVFLGVAADGPEFLVTGWAEVAGDIPRKRPVLLRLDAAGSVRWRRVLGADDEEGAFHAVAPRRGGGAVLAGTVLLATGHPQPRAMAVNAEGDFLWEFRPADHQGAALAAVALPDGGAVVGGYVAETPSVTRRAWLARLDATGAPMWERVFEHDGDAAIHALALAPDGALTAAGSRVAGERGEDGWILQLR